jgi:aspartate/methionine/tyrosine aminotransferase
MASMKFRLEVLGVQESPMVQIATVAENMPESLKLCYGESDGAFYAFFRIDGVTDDSAAFTSRLVRETGVALTPGVAFGEAGEGNVRLCFAAREQTITDALARLTRALHGWS